VLSEDEVSATDQLPPSQLRAGAPPTKTQPCFDQRMIILADTDHDRDRLTPTGTRDDTDGKLHVVQASTRPDSAGTELDHLCYLVDDGLSRDRGQWSRAC
jgi:hypothetical protein